jgi:FAD/FMN-containing dehydrogenase
MRFAASEGLAVVPAGAKTWLDAGNLLARADVILSTRRMDRLVSHEPADLVATVEAGMTFHDFQKQLAAAGQWLPVDSPGDEKATVGGVVATGSSGPQAFGNGPLRSFVIGLRAVLADGRQIKTGGQVVKNVAGYDLAKLFTGSLGTLSVITELTFKLRPRPAETRTIVASGDRSSLVSAGRSLVNQFHPVAVEMLSRELAEHLGFGERRAGALLVRFAGSARAVVSQTAHALKVLRAAGLPCATHDQDESMWRTLRAIVADANHDLSWTARLKPTDLNEFTSQVTALEQDGASPAGLKWHAGLGEGTLRAVARAPVYHQETIRALGSLREHCEDRGGSLVVEKAPVEIRREFDAWGSIGSAGELMSRVKKQLDPENLLSPGRIDF